MYLTVYIYKYRPNVRVHLSVNLSVYKPIGPILNLSNVPLCSHLEVSLSDHNMAADEGTEQCITSAKVLPHTSYSSNIADNDIMLIKPATDRVSALQL